MARTTPLTALPPWVEVEPYMTVCIPTDPLRDVDHVRAVEAGIKAAAAGSVQVIDGPEGYIQALIPRADWPAVETFLRASLAGCAP